MYANLAQKPHGRFLEARPELAYVQYLDYVGLLMSSVAVLKPPDMAFDLHVSEVTEVKMGASISTALPLVQQSPNIFVFRHCKAR